MTRAEVVREANLVRSAFLAQREPGQAVAPKLTEASSRETLIRWLSWNDSNGCYSDEDCEAEGHEPLTLDELWGILAHHVDLA